MKIALSTRVIALLLSTLVAVNSPAQESDESAAPITPDLTSLQSDWWAYFEGPRDAIEPNIDAFLEDVGAQIAGKKPTMMAEAARMVEGSGADFVDVNLGCPIEQANRRGYGFHPSPFG